MKTFPLLFATAAAVGGLALGARLHAEPVGLARRLIEHFKMERIPQEGPWFSLSYLSDEQVAGAALSARYKGVAHATGSAIYCLLTREDFSAMHRLQTDETWHFYGGDPLEMLLLHPDGRAETITLGPDALAGQQPQFTVRRGVWQGAAPTGRGPEAYSLIGAQLAPAFDYADFEIGYCEELQKTYPQDAAHIARLTRPEFVQRSAPAAQPPTVALTHVFAQGEIKPIEVAPGMFLRELVGRVATAKSELYSVAGFTLTKGSKTLVSYNKVSEETFLITRGAGEVVLDGKTQPVAAGSVVVIPPGVRHELRADANEGLDFFAVEAPAYRPEDFVVEPAPNPAAP